MSRKGSRLVYSTDDPTAKKRCPKCGRYPCRCPRRASRPAEEQTARIRCERKGRGGKTVTVVGNLELAPKDMEALGKALRKLCGAGGTVKEDEIEVQGDQRDRIAEALRSRGFKIKLVGG